MSPTLASAVRLALVSTTVTTVATSAHHVFRLGLEFAIPAVVAIVAPIVALYWFRVSGRRLALALFTSLNVFIFVWFGFIDGFLDHVLKALGLENVTFLPGSDAEVVATVYSLWSPAASNLFYEGTGVITAAASFVAVYANARLIQVHHRGKVPLAR